MAWRLKVRQLIEDLDARTKAQIDFATGKTEILNWKDPANNELVRSKTSAQLGATKTRRLQKEQRGRSVRVFVSSTFRGVDDGERCVH